MNFVIIHPTGCGKDYEERLREMATHLNSCPLTRLATLSISMMIFNRDLNQAAETFRVDDPKPLWFYCANHGWQSKGFEAKVLEIATERDRRTERDAIFLQIDQSSG